MSTMNSFEGVPTTQAEYQPILRASEAERDSQQSECCCPELCQIDHAN